MLRWVLAALLALIVVGVAAVEPTAEGQRQPVLAGASSTPVAARSEGAGLPARWVSGAAARRMAVPILMYHVIGHPAAGTAQPGLVTQPRVFSAQLRALARAGYTAVRLDRVLAAWDHGAALPRKPIVVSFDDGYPGHIRYAAPALRRHGWPAVLNLEVNNIGEDGLPAWAVRRLAAAGWEVDSHTVSHPDLRTLDDGALTDELAASATILRRAFGISAALLCYPAGKHDARVRAAARDAGYRAATTVEEGIASPDDDRFALPRVRADGDLRPADLLRRISRAP